MSAVNEFARNPKHWKVNYNQLFKFKLVQPRVCSF